MAQAVYLIVYCAVLFDVRVGGRNVRLGLIVVVVAYKEFHRVVRKKLAKLAAKLRRQCFVVRQHKSGLVYVCDNIRHSKCFTGACNAKQRLLLVAAENSLGKRGDRLGLITRGFVFGMKFKFMGFVHFFSLSIPYIGQFAGFSH